MVAKERHGPLTLSKLLGAICTAPRTLLRALSASAGARVSASRAAGFGLCWLHGSAVESPYPPTPAKGENVELDRREQRTAGLIYIPPKWRGWLSKSELCGHVALERQCVIAGIGRWWGDETRLHQECLPYVRNTYLVTYVWQRSLL